jgi:hypothetical protein
VKRLLALLAGGLGLRALLRRRRHAPVEAPSPADDLKAKLAATRADDEPAVGEDPEPDLDARRADVHARARQAMDYLSE